MSLWGKRNRSFWWGLITVAPVCRMVSLMVCLVLFLTVSGCGYTLNHRLKSSFTDTRGIFVPMFTNNTDELGAERAFTNALIHELLCHREIVLKSTRGQGLELLGEVASIQYGPSAFTEPGFQGLREFKRIPSEYGVRVNISLRLMDTANGSVLWSNSFSGFRRVNVLDVLNADVSRTYDYQAPSSIGGNTQSIIHSVYSDIAADIMRNVYDSLVEQL